MKIYYVYTNRRGELPRYTISFAILQSAIDYCRDVCSDDFSAYIDDEEGLCVYDNLNGKELEDPLVDLRKEQSFRCPWGAIKRDCRGFKRCGSCELCMEAFDKAMDDMEEEDEALRPYDDEWR